MTLDELVERLRKYDWHVHTSEGSKPTDIPLQAASQLLAMKEALEDIANAPCFGFYGGFRKSLVDRAKRALLPTSAADKIAEGLRDAIAIAKGGSPNSGGGDA
jgi:hypothetical protein